MTSLIDKVLNSEFEAGYKPTPEQTKLVDQLVNFYENSNLCEVLYSGIKGTYDPHKLASFFSMLIWQTPDNGAQVCATLEEWAVSNNPFKINVAHSDEIEVLLENVGERVKS